MIALIILSCVIDLQITNLLNLLRQPVRPLFALV